jgi:hypothetical protein
MDFPQTIKSLCVFIMILLAIHFIPHHSFRITSYQSDNIQILDSLDQSYGIGYDHQRMIGFFNCVLYD